jgi:hypothetical protein
MKLVIAMLPISAVHLSVGVGVVQAIGVKILIYKLLFLSKNMYKTWQK